MRAKKSSGFTLIEVLIATGILVMVGVVAVAVEFNFMNSGTRNKHKLQATGLAQQRMSDIKRIFTNNLLDPNVADKMGGITAPNPQTTNLNGKEYTITTNIPQ